MKNEYEIGGFRVDMTPEQARAWNDGEVDSPKVFRGATVYVTKATNDADAYSLSGILRRPTLAARFGLKCEDETCDR